MVSLKNKQINKILDLKLLKNKIYKFHLNKKFIQTKGDIKTSLKLVFKHYMLNKTILFLGGNKKLNSFFLKLTKNLKHFFVPNNMWFKGALTNPEIVFKHIMLSKNVINQVKCLANIKQKVSLILLFNNSFLPTELRNFKVPLVSFVGFTELCDYHAKFFKKSLDSNLLMYFLKVLKKKVKFFKAVFNYA